MGAICSNPDTLKNDLVGTPRAPDPYTIGNIDERQRGYIVPLAIASVVMLTQQRLATQTQQSQTYRFDMQDERPLKSSILSGLVLRKKTQMETDDQQDQKLIIPTKVNNILSQLDPFEKQQQFLDIFSDCEEQYCCKKEDGSVYYGQWSHGIRTGYGKILYEDQSYYEGWWINDEKHFEGFIIYPDGSVYIGSWFADQPFGNGRIVLPDSVSYILGLTMEQRAELLIKEQQSPKIYADGRKYYGDMRNEKKEGFGVMIWEDGTQYIGIYKNDKQDGHGIMKLEGGRVYEGQFHKNKMHGLGTFQWPNGNKFIGLYENDLKEGYGMFIWADGHKYRGQFKKGQMTGFGRMIMTKGKVIEAYWENGRRVKEGFFDKEESSQVYLMSPLNSQHPDFDSIDQVQKK